MTQTTAEFLLAHAATRPVSFHMPGHKGAELYRRCGYGRFLDAMMDCDITEIPGADNLFQAEDILARTQERYARLYGVKQSYLLINGTSGGILAAILAGVRPGGTLIMARNCHKSVFNGLTLGGLRPAYLYPRILAESGIAGEIPVEEVERALAEAPQAQAVILPSPNYYGICSDVRAIAAAVHRAGKVLIVDQAHGAHLKWLSKAENGGCGPLCAEEAGADIVINSIHKTLASFTQSAVLNLCSDRIDRYILEDKLQAVQSTSPSYLLMASLDINADLLEKQGHELMRQWNENLDLAYEQLKTIPGLKVITGVSCRSGLDRSKINLDTSGWGMTAAELETRLMERGIFSELTTGNILMLMTGIGNRRQDVQRLMQALQEIEKEAGAGAGTSAGSAEAAGTEAGTGAAGGGTTAAGTAIGGSRKPVYPLPPAKERIDLAQAEGRICAVSLIPYPPGIPLVCPGEKLTRDDIDRIAALRLAGEKVIGVNDGGQIVVGCDKTVEFSGNL